MECYNIYIIYYISRIKMNIVYKTDVIIKYAFMNIMSKIKIKS